MTTKTHYPLSNTLFACCGLVFLMVIVGGMTRLTESGLSMVEWKPLIGAIPPLSEKEWHRVFDLYQQSPEFQKKNFWMDLGDFKQIFFWEWLHRFLGRFIGIAYALPLLWFWARKQIPPGYKIKLLVPFILGGLQGALGWYMVKSGLVDNPAVSHYRLAAHLLLALLIYGVMLWFGLSLRATKKSPDRVLFVQGIAALLFLVMTIIWGAFTAGLDAGLIYNDSFPKMGGAWIPPEAYTSILATPAGVQFLHRWLAIATVLMVAGFWLHAAIRKSLFPALNILAVMIMLQAGLGILTLFSAVWIPAAALHQAGALVSLTLLMISLHRLNPAIP
jgi:cytochrome c oxidase assembly protein subunit 15